MTLKPAQDSQLQEIEREQHREHGGSESRQQHRGHRRHENAVEREVSHERDVPRGRREQPAARARVPEVAPLPHHVDRSLAAQDEHYEDDRLQLLQGKVKPVTPDEEHRERQRQDDSGERGRGAHQLGHAPAVRLVRVRYPVGRDRHGDEVVGEQQQHHQQP